MTIEGKTGFRLLSLLGMAAATSTAPPKGGPKKETTETTKRAPETSKTTETEKVSVFKKAKKCPFDINIPDKYSTHPGGEQMLELGRLSMRPDTLFLSYHCGFDLDGKIAEECKRRGVKMPERGPIYDEIHEAMLKIRRERPEQAYIHFAWVLLVSVMTFYRFYQFTVAPTIFGTLQTAFWFIAYAYNVFHTRNHKGGKLFHIKWLDSITKPLFDGFELVWVITPRRWRLEHNVEHHVYTNSEVDSDIYGLFPFFRFHHEQKLEWFHAWQSVYAPILGMLSAIRQPIENLELELQDCKPEERWFHQTVFGIWLLHACSFYYNHGWSGVGCWLLFYLIVGESNFYFFQVSHNQNPLGNEATGDWKNIDEWIKQQAEESISWGGYFATLYSGALNLQVEHHMAPGHDTTFYYFLMPELKRIFKKHGIPYNYSNNLWTAICDHHQFLSAMGNPM